MIVLSSGSLCSFFSKSISAKGRDKVLTAVKYYVKYPESFRMYIKNILVTERDILSE